MAFLKVLLLLTFSLIVVELPADVPVRGRLLFLGIAYDGAPGPGLTVDDYNYAPDNFSRLFQELSMDLFREIKVETLKGRAATRQAVMNRLRGLKTQVKSDDVVFVYWGTHGETNNREWSAGLPGNGKILGSEIKAELAQLACPAIVVISTCGSGGFIRPTPRKVELPTNVAAFCACRRKQSTNNELDVTLLEALSGFGDANSDGHVTVKEAFQYVPRRYRKLIKDAEGAETEPVLEFASGFPVDRALAKVNEKRVAVAYDGVWYGAHFLENANNKAKVRFLGWDSTSTRGPYAFPDSEAKPDSIDLPGGFPPVEVEWNGTWYPATVIERRGTQLHIHYVGYPDSDNETVPLKRIRLPFVGDKLSADAERAS